MANYDQSGNPVGARQQSGMGQQGGNISGGQGTQSPGQQAQFAGSSPSQYGGTNVAQPQGGDRNMERSSRGMSSYGGGLFPDLYAGFGGGPFQLISRLSDEMDRLFEGFGMGALSPRSGQRGVTGQGQGGAQGVRQLWAPHIEVAERDGKLLIQADLPGVRKDDVNVQLEEDAVIIQGQRHQENTRSEQGFYHSERSYGSFYRMIPLPEGVNVDEANATFRDGVLHIELPLPQQRQRGRRLEIRDTGGSDSQLGRTLQGGASQTSGMQAAGQATQGTGSATQQAQGPSGTAQHGAAATPAGKQAEGSSERR